MRKLTNQELQEMARENAKWPETLAAIQITDWPRAMLAATNPPCAVLRSREFLVQVFAEPGHIIRMTVNRTTHDNKTGTWREGITWDELQRLKAEAGFGDLDAVEVYPADRDVVNVSSMRHLWILPKPVPFAWRKK